MTALALAYTIDPEVGEDSPSGASLRGPHRLAAAGTCDRMWALRYYWYFRPRKENPWRLGGTLIHTCMEYFYARIMERQGRCPPEWYFKQTLLDRLHDQVRMSDAPHIQREALVAMAIANLQQYASIYENDQKLLRPLYIEEEFSATLGELDPGGPWPELDNEIVTVRSDLVYETERGYISVMDYKSHGRSKVNPKTGRLRQWNMETNEYALNFQVLMNLHVLRARFGSRVREFVIQRSTRQEPYDFDRPVLIIPQEAYREAPRTMRELVKHEHEVMQRITAGEKPSPRFHACYGKYGPCDYRSVCLAPNKDEAYKRLYRDFEQLPAEEVASMHARLRVVQ